MSSRLTVRFYIIFGVMALMTTIIILRIFYLYQEEGDFLKAKGDYRTISVRDIPHARGAIYDANNYPLASSLIKYNLYGLKGLDTSNLDLSFDVLNQDTGFLKKKKILKEDISLAEIQEIKSKRNDYLEIESFNKRIYPLGEQIATLIGFAGADNKGLEGLEKEFENHLKEEVGKKQIFKNRRQEIIKPPKILNRGSDGNNLKLTIKHEIQYSVHKSLSQGVIQAQAKGGSAVVLDNETGRILAIASYPSYNPNDPNRIIQRNRALLDSFEPGSVIKPIALAIGIENNDIDFNKSVETGPGYIELNSQVIADLRNYGSLLPIDIIAKSSQVGAAKIALEIDSHDLINGYKRFGLAVPPNINFPSIAYGKINQRSNISDHEIASLGFGYGLEASAIQLAMAFSVFANDGVLKGFQLVDEKDHSNPSQVISKHTAELIMESLEQVIIDGTGTQAKHHLHRVAGKTGTSHKVSNGKYDKSKYISSFIGIGPLETKKYTILVTIDEPGLNRYSGGEVAAPVFKEIFDDLVSL